MKHLAKSWYPSFRLSPISISFLCCVLSISMLGCKSHSGQSASTHATSSANAQSQAHEARVQFAVFEAQFEILSAHNEALSRALRVVDQQMRDAQRTRVSDSIIDFAEDSIAILFTANMHGEFEDCGCRSNPLGGLTRRQTLLNHHRSSDVNSQKRWWNGALPANQHSFVVDAGDLFYASSTLNRSAPEERNKALIGAQKMVEALNVDPPDAIAVGELDVVFGIDTLREIAARAKFPLISANLANQNRELIFPGHVVAKSGERKVAFIGLTKELTRIEDYYRSRNIIALPAYDSYRKEIEKLPHDVNLVVLLSNLGINATQELVAKLRQQKLPINAAIVSNSNRLTKEPVWQSGVPIMEPMSRGRYFGRLDIALASESDSAHKVSFKNANTDFRPLIRNYRRAWGGYIEARKKRHGARHEFMQLLFSEEESAPHMESSLDGKEHTGSQRQSRMEFVEKQIAIFDQRVKLAADDVNATASHLQTTPGNDVNPRGADIAAVRIVPVDLKLEEDSRVRKVLDRATH